MDWRTRLRKLVNREGRLGPGRLALLRAIDPVEWYMRRNDPKEEPRRHQVPNAVGWTSYGPLPGSSSELPEAPFGAVRSERTSEDAEGRIEDDRSRLRTFRREHAILLETKARELLTGKQTEIETSMGSVRAKLVRFRNGAVIEQWHTSPQASGHGMMRVERRNFSDLVSLIVDYLAQTIVGLGPHASPLR